MNSLTFDFIRSFRKMSPVPLQRVVIMIMKRRMSLKRRRKRRMMKKIGGQSCRMRCLMRHRSHGESKPMVN